MFEMESMVLLPVVKDTFSMKAIYLIRMNKKEFFGNWKIISDKGVSSKTDDCREDPRMKSFMTFPIHFICKRLCTTTIVCLETKAIRDFPTENNASNEKFYFFMKKCKQFKE